MATLATQSITRAGAASTWAAAAGGGDAFTPTSDTIVELKTSGTGTTFTFVTPRVVIPDVPTTDYTVVLAATETRKVGPFPAEYFADPTTGLANITYSQVTGVTVGVFALSHP